MVHKKYDFAKILKDYNKEYKQDFQLNSKIDKATIVHSLKNGSFEVTYGNENDNNRRYCLSDFVYEYVIPVFKVSDIINIKNLILRKEEHNLNLKIEILPPNKIRYAYLCNNYYAPDVGQLGKSCMRTKESQKSLNFYIKNNVKIVVIIDDKYKIHARALLWDNVKSIKKVNTFIYLDRVYTRSDELIPSFYKLAEENNWKKYGFTSPDKQSKDFYKEDINITGMCHIPWIDTFKHLYYKDGLIISSKDILCKIGLNKIKYPDSCVTLTHTDGNIGGEYIPALDPDRVQETISGSYISKKDAIFVKRYNGWVLKKNIADISGTYYSIFDDKVINTKVDGYVLKENSVTEIFTSDIINKSKALQSTKCEGYIHKTNAVYIRNEVYHKLDNDIVCFDNKWYHISQCFINYNREEVNRELIKPALTPKGNKISIKQPKFFDVDMPNNYMQSLTSIWYFTPPKCPLTREGRPVPKKHAIIAYDLIYNGILDKIEYQEVYRTDKTNLVRFVTGELIINSAKNKRYIKKFNNKWYIKQEFKLPDKNQLLLFK